MSYAVTGKGNMSKVSLGLWLWDSTTPENLLEIERYNLVRADHPNNIKRGGVCIYYKDSLPVWVISLPYLKETLLLEINDNNKKMIVSVIYRSPSQNNRELDSFLLNFEQLLSDISTRKPTMPIITGNFNARSSFWWSDDINTLEGIPWYLRIPWKVSSNLYSLTSSNGFSQLINEPTHVKQTVLVFTDQPNLSVNSGVHASLHSNCHHQIVHTSFNLNI